MVICIKNVFVDKNDNIFVLDNNDILYRKNDNIYYPFSIQIKNIKKCFIMNDKIFIHNNNTLFIFEDEINKIIDSENSNWLSRKIDQIDYHPIYNLFITLEKGIINLYASNSSDGILKISFNEINNMLLCKKFKLIKILKDYLFVYGNKQISIFQIQNDNISYLNQFYSTKNNFNRIDHLNEQIIYLLELNNQDYDNIIRLFNGKNIILNEQINNFYDTYENKILIYQIDNYLEIYYPYSKYISHIKPLITSLKEYSTNEKICTNKRKLEIFIFNDLLCSSKISFKSSMAFKYVIENGAQIIICGGKACILNDKFEEIIINNNNIYYDTLIELKTEKTDELLIIDIDLSKSIINQLINIIPNIYRLNNDFVFHFENVDTNDNIISYGDGITRSVFTKLRREIDDFFLTNMDEWSESDIVKIGKLLYFCNYEGNEKFFNIHPYFFYKISNGTDIEILLEHLKGINYKNQYLKYQKNINELKELDMDFNNINDYLNYLFTIDLTNKKIESYNTLVNGYQIFLKKNSIYNIIKHLSILYIIKQLVGKNSFITKINFHSEKTISDDKLQEYINNFNNCFDKLTDNDKSLFVNNITGSQYYNNTIKIIFSYNHEISNTKKLNYQIITCQAELIIFDEPNKENINNILDSLIVEDYHIKN